MRLCDVCQEPTQDTKFFDQVVTKALAATELSGRILSTVVEKLGIKTTLVDKKPSFGDVCPKCADKMVKDLEAVVQETVTSLTKSILDIANLAKRKITEAEANIAFFNKVAGDGFPGERLKGRN